MKKTILVLLALLLAVTVTLALVACEEEDPCQNGQHSYAEEVIRPATCQTEGAKIQRCKKCGATTAEEVIPKLDHVWDEGVVTKQPTCAEEGVKTFTCTTCDPEVAEPATKTENISVTSNHKYGNLIDEKAASCIQPGTMAHFECADCRKLFVDIDGGGKKEVQASELVIPATGHSYALATDAWSWSDDNLTATLHLVCGNCDDQTENHAFTIDFGSEVSDVEGSCTTPSTVTYTVTVTKEAIQAKLGENDKLSIAADDETKLTASKTVEGVVAGHDYQATFVWAETYSGSGLPAVTVTLKCSRNDSSVTEELSPVVVEKADSRKQATCGQDGSVTFTVSVEYGQKTYTGEEKTYTLPATGEHNYEGQPYVSGGEAGHHQECVVCGKPNEDVSHTLDKFTPVEGKQQHTVGCSVCNYVQEQSEDCTVEDNKCTKCDAEYTPVTQEEGKFVVVGKGSFSAGEWTEEAKNRFTHYINGEENTHNNSITLNFKAGDVFKIKLWDKEWSDTDDFAYGCDVWFDGGKVEGLPSKDGWDNLILLVQGEENGNVKVTVDCNLTLTIYDDNAHKLNITVNSISGELPEPTPSEGGYWLVGQFNNVSSWGDGLGSAKKFNYDEATSTYSLTVSLKAGDQWKIKADGDKDWKDQVKGTTPREVNFNTADKPTDLFVGSDNINVNYDCTITITFKTTASIVVTVSDITVTATEFTYTFYLYAPNWSKPYIYMWECVIQTTGAPDNWPGDPMTPVSGKTGWYTYSKTSKVNFEGKVQNVIMSDNGSNDVRLGFEVKNGVGKQVTLSNSPMYFNADKGLNQYKSAEEAGVSTSPISNVTPLQVAALPTQGIAKRRLAA